MIRKYLGTHRKTFLQQELLTRFIKVTRIQSACLCFHFIKKKIKNGPQYMCTAIPVKTFVYNFAFFERMTKDRLSFEFQ